MFGLTFLSTEKKKRLEKYQDRLSRALSPRERNETLLAIQEIEASAKPYQKCNIEEADELRRQLLDKIYMSQGVGKLQYVEVFRSHLREVEFHIATQQMAEKLQEEAKMKQPEEAGTLKDKLQTVTAVKREKKKKEAFGQPRWVIGFEDEPDGTNK